MPFHLHYAIQSLRLFKIAIFLVLLCLSQSLQAQISFQPQVTYTLPNTGTDVTIGDFNRDGILDIAATTNVGPYPDNPAQNFVFLGLGNGAFGAPTTFDPGGECWSAGQLKAADLNNDGKLDLILAEGGSNELCFGNVMSVQLGDGLGGFGAGIITHTGGSLLSFAVGDFNEDRNMDLAVRSADQQAILILLGNGDGTFTEGMTLGPAYSENIVAVDLNGDGHLDIAATYADGVRVFFGDGTGHFSSPVFYAINNPTFFGIAAGDFNGDGIPDLAVSNGSQGAVFVLLGTGGGQFAAPVAFPAGTNPQSEVIVADFDGDGHQDIAVGNCGADTVSVLKGDGQGGFAAPATFAAGTGSGCRLASGVLTTSSLPDLVTSSQAGMSVLLNSSQLTNYSLTVSITGTGTVISMDGSINCPGTCTHSYSSGAPVTLNAAPASGWTFAGWSGACSGTGSCSVFMTQAQSVSATFTQNQNFYSLSVSTGGSGSGTVISTDNNINCPGICGYSYLSNTQVTLNATAAPGSTFAGWGGACSGTGSCNLTMTSNFSVFATFTQNQGFFSLTVAPILGGGTVTSTDGDITCPGTCSYTYPANMPVTLNATPNSGGTFNGWGGACSGTSPCNVTMTANLTVTANFSSATQEVLLHSFGTGHDGQLPASGLISDSTGDNFYGTTSTGGLFGYGRVFKLHNGMETELYDFLGNSDGQAPFGSLVFDTAGNLYGTTSAGGIHGGGTLFELSPNGTETVLYSFGSGRDGRFPYAELIFDASGNIYGTTVNGGAYGQGTAFELSPQAGGGWMETKLYSFGNGNDGQNPYAGLTFDSSGNLYGTTYAGGMHGQGTVFELSPNRGGGWAETVLYSFGSGADGALPYAGVIFNSGNLYGTTVNGGMNHGGTAFELSPSGGGGWTEAGLYSFGNGSDGQNPYAGLVFDTSGNLYGTTSKGGLYTGGTVFELPDVAHGCCREIMMYSFGNGNDGQNPHGGLTPGPSGSMLGTTAYGGGPSSGGTVFQITPGPPQPGQQFVPITPCRAVDTRQSSPIPGGMAESFPLAQSGNLCNLPANVVAYSLNVAVVPQQTLGYLTIWPTGQAQPLVSTLNSPDGRIKANAAIVAAGSPSGSVSVYVTDTTNVIFDINGYFVASSPATLAFYTLTPCRVIDTRGAIGALGGPYLVAQVERDFPVLESSCIPQGVTIAAYSMNFAAVPHQPGQPLGYLTVWAKGQPQPLVSTLNNPTGTVVANAAIVSAGTGGGIATWPYNDTDLVVDINGYFAAPGTGGYSFYAVAPCRVYDSRNNNGQPFTGERTVPIAGSPCAPPSNAGAYVLNAAVVPSGSLGYLTLWADQNPQQPPPVVVTLNAYDGFITSNMAIVPNVDGSTDALAAYGYTQLILDISGYFAP